MTASSAVAVMADGDPTALPCTACPDELVMAGDEVTCANVQCAAAGLGVPLWRAHQRLVAAGGDVPAPGAGWPRPLFDGLPHTYLTPVVRGRAWWRHVDSLRLEQCQLGWLCQVCGEALPSRVWVWTKPDGAVVMASAMHERCLRLAQLRCPALAAPDGPRTALEVGRDGILVDGKPLETVLAAEAGRVADGFLTQDWSVAAVRGAV